MTEGKPLYPGRSVCVHEPRRRTAALVRSVVQDPSTPEGSPAGTLHFLEHLAMRGEPGGESVHATADALGARIEAWTDQERLTFAVVCPAVQVGEAQRLLDVFAMPPAFDDEAIRSEREVIQQEIARTNDDPRELATDVLYQAAFGLTGLGAPILAIPEDLTVEGLRKEAEDVWSPDRMLSLAVGDLAAVKHDDAAAPSGRPVANGNGAVFRPGITVKSVDLEQSYLRFWYPLPTQPDQSPANRLALASVVANLLGGSMASRLGRRLRVEESICYSFHAHAVWHRAASGIRIMLAAAPSRADEAFHGVLDTVASLGAHGLDSAECARSKALTIGELILECETSLALAEHALTMVHVFDRVVPIEAAAKAVEHVTEPLLQDFAAELGTPAFACVGPNHVAEFCLP
jgi:predicted Zn-dependent peptidase